MAIPTLSDYILDVRRYLHEAKPNYWTDPELTTYINKARVQVATDTGIFRAIRQVDLQASQEQYVWNTPGQDVNGINLGVGSDVISVLSIFVIWSSTRYPIQLLSMVDLNKNFRMWVPYLQYPVAAAQVGMSHYFAPMPDQIYLSEWDCVLVPPDLKNTTDVEDAIWVPFLEPIDMWATYLAKKKEQNWSESEKWRDEYYRLMMNNAGSSIFRRA